MTGRVHPDQIMIKGGLRPRDRLFLTKPLGTGVITTAAKGDATDEATLQGAVTSMLRLNRGAAAVAGACGARGATDVTGFGLLGHLTEMVEASGAGVAIQASRLPLLPGALTLAAAGRFSGGMLRNRRHVEAVLGNRLVIDGEVEGGLGGLLFEAETSGGLLFSVAANRAADVVREAAERGEVFAEIGEVIGERSIRITR